jgi:integrase
MAAKGERGLKEIAPGLWRISWSFEGRWVRRKVRGPKTLAKRMLDAVRGDIAAGRYIPEWRKKKALSVSFADACERFRQWGRANLRPGTWERDENFIHFWLEWPGFKGKALDAITVEEVEGYRNHRASSVKQKTADNDLMRLRRLFALCEAWGLCEKNPARKVKLFRPESQKTRVLSDEEANAVLEKAPAWLQGCIRFTLATGLRASELLSLTWEAVDLRERSLKVSAETAKSKRSRVIPLNSDAVEVLKSLPRPIQGEARVFPRHYLALRKAWETACKEAGVNGATWHTLRHTFTTRLIESGADLESVRLLLGHSTLVMVMKYSHVRPEHLRGAVTLLEKNYPHKTRTANFGGGAGETP